jgi:hypothetical protein
MGINTTTGKNLAQPVAFWLRKQKGPPFMPGFAAYGELF